MAFYNWFKKKEPVQTNSITDDEFDRICVSIEGIEDLLSTHNRKILDIRDRLNVLEKKLEASDVLNLELNKKLFPSNTNTIGNTIDYHNRTISSARIVSNSDNTITGIAIASTLSDSSNSCSSYDSGSSYSSSSSSCSSSSYDSGSSYSSDSSSSCSSD